MAPRKRPSAKTGCGGQKKSRSLDAGVNVTDVPFDFQTFLQELWAGAGYQVSDKSGWKPLEVFTGCSGLGTPVWVLCQILGAGYVHEIGAVEMDSAACLFMMRNLSPKHIFADMEEVARDKKRARCNLHGTMCALPTKTESLYICGFACPPYSRQNKDRFAKDCITEGNQAHLASFYACVEQLKTRQPMYAILENSDGILFLVCS